MVQHLMAVCVVCLLCVEQLPCQLHFDTTSNFILEADQIGMNYNKNSNNSSTNYSLLYQHLPNETYPTTGVRSNNIMNISTSNSETKSNRDVLNNSHTYIYNNASASISESIKRRRKRHANHNSHSDHKKITTHDNRFTETNEMPKITQQYLQNLFNEYGADNGMITLSSFQRMLRQLGLTQLLEQRLFNKHTQVPIQETNMQTTPTQSESSDIYQNNTCITETSLLYLLHDLPVNCNNHTMCHENLNAEHVLGKQDMLHMCPILLQQLASPLAAESKGCIAQSVVNDIKQQQIAELVEHLNSNKQNMVIVWTYAFIAVLACSILGLVGVAIIPFMDSYYYKHIIQFLVALAVGTMTGDALLHLLPHSLADQTEENMIYKGLVCMSGILFFYITEHGLTMVSEWRKQKAKRNNKNPKWQMAQVVLEPDSTRHIDSVACTATGCDNAEKVCKPKYSAYPYCYDDIAMDMLHDVLLHMPKNANPNSNAIPTNVNNLEEAADSTDESKLKVERKRNGRNIAADKDLNELGVVQSLLHNQHDHQNSTQPPSQQQQQQQQSQTVIQHNCHQLQHSHNHYPQLHLLSLHHQDSPNELVNSHKQHVADGSVINGDCDCNCSACDGIGQPHGHPDDGAKVRTDSDNLVSRAASLEPDGEAVTVIVREHDTSHRGHSRKHGHVHSPPESLSAVAWMIIMGDGLHNFTDGMAIGAAFAENIAGGFSTALAVFCHELPHELGDFAILMKAGMSVKSAVYYNLLTGILSFVGMIFGIVFGQSQEAAQWMFATAAGLFIYIALVDMMPEISAHKSVFEFALQIIGIGCGVALMLLIAIYETDLMNVFPAQ